MWRELASSQTFIFSHFKELSSYFWPLILKGWLMGSGATQPGLPERLLNEGHGREAEREGKAEESKKEEIWRRCHLIFPPSGSPSCCSPLLSPPFAITFHCHSSLQSPLTTRAALPSLAVSRCSSFPLFSIHTNDSVKQVKCYKIPPEAQPA